jgi:chromosome segregation protein
MRLAKLTLCGFKSFADRTEFTFDDAVTGIVGPNGCGKSNVVDAIRWVLGERSTKSLRGTEMIDVIFAGSAGRKPAGLASATLTFDNPPMEDVPAPPPRVTADPERAPGADAAEVSHSDGEPPAEFADEESEVEFDRAGTRRRALPIDADTVEVERRLYRDGTSQYLINGKRARLRDVRELFLDTGVGADAYSIIEQGKVDAMLLANPQERRTIFEEAAGIAKYKQRRIEAQRKLERAQANLEVTREQLASTERRLRITRGQAAKARRFKELDGELRALRAALAFDQYDDVRQRLDGLTSSLAQLEGVRAEAASALARLEHAKQEAELARHELFSTHKGIEERRLAAVHAEQSASQRRQITQRALADARAQFETDGARVEHLDRRLAELRRADEAQAQLIANLAEALGEADRRLTAASERRAEVMETLASNRAALAERRAVVADIDRQIASLTASLEADRRRRDAIHETLARLAQKAASLDSQRADLMQSGHEAAEAAASVAARAAVLEGEHAAADREAQSLSQARRSLAERVLGLEQQHLRADGRRQTLREMVDARVELGEAARDVLARRDSGEGFVGTIAPLTDLLEADAAVAAAVEATLAADLTALIVESSARMPDPRELASLKGRVTFLPLGTEGRAADQLASGLLSETHPSSALRTLIEAGRIMPLRELVRVRPPNASLEAATERLADRLLAGTYLVDDLDVASMLAAASPGARFVTRDGSVLERDGRVSSGPFSYDDERGAGAIQRRAELAELEGRARELEHAATVEREVLARADAEAAALSARQADLRSRLAAEQRALIGEQARQERVRADLLRLDRDRAEVAEESAEETARLEGLDQDGAGLADRVEKLSRLREDEASAVRDLEAAIADAQARADAASDQATAAQVESGRLSEQVAAGRREHRRLHATAEQVEAERHELMRLCEQSRLRLVEHEHTIAEAAAQIEHAAAEARALETESAAAESRLREAGEQIRELSERVHAAREHAHRVERDWHSLEVARREVEVKRENLEARASEELALDLAFDYADYRAMIADGVSRIDPARAAADIDHLREEVRKLGSVNLEAIDEEAQLAQRNEELIRQVADIDDAAGKLADLIAQLNLASRERFGEVFAAIQAHFAGADGMFRKLFGGGRAEIRLMPLVKEVDGQKVETDQVDLLESGVEVIAKPPGKEPRSISQLSGGERTLTAVALLLSIFRSKPSCFCVLDEVDAALDDANVGRYCAVVREFTSHSRFIVITHNKKTMQVADRLYGVTMQEHGVSTRVSVRFEQVGKDGTIHGARPPGPDATAEARPRPDAEPDRERKGMLRRALAEMRETSAGTPST